MFSKAKTNRLPVSSSNKRNHNGATFKCDVTAEEILKSGNDCLNPAHNCRGSVSGTKFTDYDSMPTDSMFKRGKKFALKKAIDGCKLSLTNNVVRGFSNAADSARTKITSIGNSVGSLKKKVGTFGTASRFGGKSRRKRRKRRKSRKKRRKSKKKSRRKRKKSRRKRH
jgi:hypothetical protein